MSSKKRGLNRGLNALLADTLGSGSDNQPEVLTRRKSKPSKVAQSEKKPNKAVKRKVVPTAPLVRSRVVAPTSPVKTKERVEPKQSTEDVDKSVHEGGKPAREFINLGIEKLSPGRFQPRKGINESELEELATSIKSHGLLQPVVARQIKEQQYEIIAGERRWRASQLAGLKEIPVVVKKISDEDACAVGLVENIQRQALNAMEEAVGIDRLIKQFDLTHAEVATTVGKSRTAITNLLRLLNLEPEVKGMLERGEIDNGHAKVLLMVSGAKQCALAREVINNKLSVRETEELVSAGESERSRGSSPRPLDPDVKRLQRRLSEKFGTKIKIQHGAKGKGKLIIHYNDLEALDGILAIME